MKNRKIENFLIGGLYPKFTQSELAYRAKMGFGISKVSKADKGLRIVKKKGK